MAFELLKEDDDAFYLKDKKGKESRIAKQALSDALHERVRGYAKGGRVENPFEKLSTERESMMTPAAEPAPKSISATDLAVEDDLRAKQDAYNMKVGGGGRSLPLGLEGTDVDLDRYFAKDSAPGNFQPQAWEKAETAVDQKRLSDFNRSQIQAEDIARQNEVRARAGLPPLPTPQVASMQGGMPTGIQIGGENLPQQVPTAGGQGLAPLDPVGGAPVPQPGGGAYGELLKGVNTQEQAQIKLAQDQERVQADKAQAEQEAMGAYQERVKGLQAQNDQLFKDAYENKIDPNRFWSSRSTGQKVSAVISLIIGGIGQGLAGGPNHALQMLDKMVDQDIEAQRANMGKAQSLYSMNLQKLGDERAAYFATKSQIASVADAKLAQAAAKAGTQTAQAAAMQARGQIKMAQQQYQQESAKLQTQRQIQKYTQDTGDLRYADYLDPKSAADLRGRAVQGIGVAPTKEVATKINEGLQTKNVVKDSLGALRKFATKPMSSLNPQDKAEAATIQDALVGQLRLLLVGPGPLTDAERGFIKQMIANPTDIFTVTSTRRLDALEKTVNRNFNSMLKTYGLKPTATLDLQPAVKK